MKMTDTNIPAAARAALADAGADRREARARHAAATAALDSAREVLQDAQAEVDRLSAEEHAWHERLSRKIAQWIEAGSRGQKPVASADAKATLALASARANLAAAQGALPQFEAAAQAASQALEAAKNRVVSLKLEAHGWFVESLIARREQLERETHEIRQLCAATLAHRTVAGAPSAFAGVLTPAQVARLSTAPSWVDFHELHGVRRAVVDVNTPISAAREPLAESLDFWMCRDAELEAIAERGEIPQTEEAAA